MVTQLFDVDVCIAGGSAAGLAAAIACALRGRSVMVVDAAMPPVDKACGEGLMPDGLAALSELSVTLDDVNTAELAGIRFIKEDRCAEAPFPGSHGRGVRRIVLHRVLYDRATQLGVRFLWGNRIHGLDGHFLTASSRMVCARWIVGADGINSQVRRWTNLDHGICYTRRIGTRRHYAVKPWTKFVEIYWGDVGQAYVTPISHSEVCVALIAREKRTSLDAMLASFPALWERLADGSVSSTQRGSLSLDRRLDRVTSGHVALIGDASGSVDAITGEGLALCFRQAVALADSITAGSLAGYEKEHPSIRKLPSFMSKTMLLLDRYPFLRRRAMKAFEHSPQLFESMLRVHIGDLPLNWWGNSGILQLGMRLLSA